MKKVKILNISIKNNKFGKNVTIIKPVNIYGSVIEDNVFIGPYVEVQKNSRIGKNTKIQSHSFICELVTIGKNCFIGHGVNFINDRFKNHKPAMGNKFLWEETYVGDNVYIGSNSTILPVKICSNVVIGAGSVITKDIKKSGVYFGHPAKKIK